jgi:hypothetical protein
MNIFLPVACRERRVLPRVVAEESDGDRAIRPATGASGRTLFLFFDRTRRSAIQSALGSGEGPEPRTWVRFPSPAP